MVESVLVMLSPAFNNFGWCVAQAAVPSERTTEPFALLRVLPRNAL